MHDGVGSRGERRQFSGGRVRYSLGVREREVQQAGTH